MVDIFLKLPRTTYLIFLFIRFYFPNLPCIGIVQIRKAEFSSSIADIFFLLKPSVVTKPRWLSPSGPSHQRDKLNRQSAGYRASQPKRIEMPCSLMSRYFLRERFFLRAFGGYFRFSALACSFFSSSLASENAIKSSLMYFQR